MSRSRVALALAVLLPVALAACGSSPHRATGPVSVVSVPVRTARTTLGTVEYRIAGSGPPLVMIMGYAGTMETWDPRFVDALARRHRVVIFDNAGIGQTQTLPSPLTIDAMADQTGALIEALGFKQADVLGWSMGSMIAQALAVRYPAQVRRLVLCAAFPGTGPVVEPSQGAVRALTSGNSQEVQAVLYPADQAKAYDAFTAAIARYPSPPTVPQTVIAAQAQAIRMWWSGTDPAGRTIASISQPTLVADGRIDQIDAIANSYAVARLIEGARLVFYPDAGHAFLFQDGTGFVGLVESFLSGH